jgi:hypothetical protein
LHIFPSSRRSNELIPITHLSHKSNVFRTTFPAITCHLPIQRYEISLGTLWTIYVWGVIDAKEAKMYAAAPSVLQQNDKEVNSGIMEKFIEYQTHYLENV